MSITKTSYSWENIVGNKLIDLKNLTSLVIHNQGHSPFYICGQLITPGQKYVLPTDGTVCDFKMNITFISVPGATLRKAILEKKWVISSGQGNSVSVG